MRGLWLRAWRLLRRRASEREIEEELRFHVDMEAEQHRRPGVDQAEARRRALVAFGGTDRWRESVRAARGTAWIEDTARDIRLACRALARAPASSAARHLRRADHLELVGATQLEEGAERENPVVRLALGDVRLGLRAGREILPGRGHPSILLGDLGDQRVDVGLGRRRAADPVLLEDQDVDTIVGVCRHRSQAHHRDECGRNNVTLDCSQDEPRWAP
jgi:hypothetical protein